MPGVPMHILMADLAADALTDAADGPAACAERFQFEVSQGGTEDPDQAIAGGAMARQTVGKIKDVLSGSQDAVSD